MTIPQDRSDILGKKGFAHVATIGPNGQPQSNPVWFDWDGEFLKISQTTTRQKYRNVRRDPHIAVSIADPENPYRYLEIRGSVTKIEDDQENAFINKLAKKYIDQDTYPWDNPSDHRVIVYIEPAHTTKM